MKYDVIIVGAGASGMMAAITAASHHKKVLLLERMDKLGKKILATGYKSQKEQWDNETERMINSSQFKQAENRQANKVNRFLDYLKDKVEDYINSVVWYKASDIDTVLLKRVLLGYINSYNKKEEEIPTTEKDELNDLDKKWDELKNKKENIFAGYANNNKVIRQLIDLALLQNNMLKGEALNNFVKRSIELI